MSFLFDIETLGKESNTVVLSAALLYVDFTKDFTYDELLDQTLFVKFKVSEQIKELKRTTQKDTIDWWKGQPREVQEMSLIPSTDDVSVAEGMQILADYYTSRNVGGFIWIRGSMDNLAIDSLAEYADVKPFAPWWRYRDVRTFLDLMKTTTGGKGYCDVPGFDVNQVKKHDPIHDVCYDAMMMKYGE